MSNYSLDNSLSSTTVATNGNDNKGDNERTSVVYGTDNVISTELQFFSNSNRKIDTCMNYTRPHLAIALGYTRSNRNLRGAFILLDILKDKLGL